MRLAGGWVVEMSILWQTFCGLETVFRVIEQSHCNYQLRTKLVKKLYYRGKLVRFVLLSEVDVILDL